MQHDGSPRPAMSSILLDVECRVSDVNQFSRAQRCQCSVNGSSATMVSRDLTNRQQPLLNHQKLGDAILSSSSFQHEPQLGGSHSQQLLTLL
jgi:hypothetical protein